MTLQIDRLSTTSSKLTLYCNGHVLGPATGFIWMIGKRLFLVSNWHVLAGRNTYTGQPLHSSAAVPDQLHFHFAEQEASQIKWLEGRLDLHDAREQATWLQHPTLGQDIDIGAIEIPVPGVTKTFLALTEEDTKSDIAISVGSEVFIVGYPLGMAKQLQLPIWKRGSIASEFSVPFDGLPIFVVDTATREGMSGSPVYARSMGAYISSGGGLNISTGITSKFLGVYSGRYGSTDELSAQLGRVWHSNMIQEVISGNTKASYKLR